MKFFKKDDRGWNIAAELIELLKNLGISTKVEIVRRDNSIVVFRIRDIAFGLILKESESNNCSKQVSEEVRKTAEWAKQEVDNRPYDGAIFEISEYAIKRVGVIRWKKTENI